MLLDASGNPINTPVAVQDLTPEELEQIEKEKLMTRDNFVLAYLLPMNPNICHRDDAIKIIEKSTFPMVLHIPTSVVLKETGKCC